MQNANQKCKKEYNRYRRFKRRTNFEIPWKPKGLFQFKIIINVLALSDSFEYLCYGSTIIINNIYSKMKRKEVTKAFRPMLISNLKKDFGLHGLEKKFSA